MKKISKRILAALFAAVLLCTTLFSLNIGTAFAATSGSCGTNATWSYNASTHTLTISGTGATKDYRDTTNKILRTEQAPWIEYKEQIQKVVVNSGITEIGDYAFFECVALTSVSLPDTLQKLDGWGGAVGNVDKTYGCFQSCTALENITLPSSLLEIESYVFNGCTALKKIEIPNNVTTIGKYAFFECSALERVSFGNAVTSLGENAFRNTGLKRINWNEALTAIPNSAFFGSGLVEVELPETIQSVGQTAFKNCTFLRDFTVNNRNTSFNGNVCEGSNQSITVHGHSGSTAQTFAEQYSYAFVSLDACPHTNTHQQISKEATCAETGTLQTICDDCGAVILETEIPATGHEWGDPVEELDCTQEDGHIYKSYVCSVCGDTKTDAVHQYTSGIDPTNIDPTAINFDASNLTELANLIRNFDWSELSEEPIYVWVDGYYTKTVLRQSSCTQYGGEYYKCDVEGCNKRELRPLLPHHTVTNWTVTKQASCTEDGTKTGTCTECGETVTETIKATGHTYNTETPAEQWDDDEDGHTHKVYICETCGTEIEEYVHNEWIEGFYTPTQTTYDNCEMPGLELDKCDVCGTLRTQTIPPRGEHDLYETSRTEPDCTARGRIYLACHNCSFTTVEYTPALGHDYVIDESNSTEATCTENGYEFYRCTRCSASKTETVEALGHTPVEGSFVTDKAPGCETAGSGHGTCERCNEAYTLTMPALGHNYENQETDLTAEGKPGHVLSVPVCTRCNQRDTGEIVHKEWTEGNYTVTLTTPATCTVGKTEVRQCTLCNKIGTVEAEPAPGHMWHYSGILTSDMLPANALSGITLPGVSVDDLTGNAAIKNALNNLPVTAEVTDNGVAYHGNVTADGVAFLCPHCLNTVIKPIAEVRALWSFDVLNTAPNRTGAPIKDEAGEITGEETDQTSYLDLNGDGIINGKDWGYIKTLTAAQEQAIADKEAEEAQPEN